MEYVQFTVYGKPATAGSKRAFAYLGKDGKPHANMAPDNKRQRPFMAAVAAEAALKSHGLFWDSGPLSLGVYIVRLRPKSHFGTGKNAEELKPSSRALMPTSPPDSLKIVRAIEDALKGVLYRDDAQICHHVIDKTYGEADLVQVTVGPFR